MESEKKKNKIVHSTNSPYPAVQWPPVANADQRAILDVLCDFLHPVGQYRRKHVCRSTGKRSKRRRRRREDKEAEKSNTLSAPPVPEVARHITVGFNTTVHLLQDLARHPVLPDKATFSARENPGATKKVAAVFVCTATLPALLTTSMPALVAAASPRHHPEAPIRLVSLPKEAEKRLAEALFQPRVGFLSLLQDAPGGKAVIDMTMGKVSQLEVPWMKSCAEVEYMPVSINSTSSPVNRDENTR